MRGQATARPSFSVARIPVKLPVLQRRPARIPGGPAVLRCGRGACLRRSDLVSECKLGRIHGFFPTVTFGKGMLPAEEL